LVFAVRWGTLGVGLAMAAFRGPRQGHVLVWGMLLLANALWWTLAARTSSARSQRWRQHLPRRLVPEPAAEGRSNSWILAELVLDVVAVVSTGYWDSPFVFCLMTAPIAAGFDGGFGPAARSALIAGLAVGIPSIVTLPQTDALQATGQWSVELLLVALVAGYTHQLFGQAEKRHSLNLDRIGQLTEANALLISLHRLAQQMPASLNLEEVLASTVSRLRGLVECDVAAVLLRDHANSRWVIAVGEGTRLSGPLTDDELPGPLAAATTSSVASLMVSLSPGEGVGVELLSRSGLYAPLRARGALIGLIALEHHEPGRYGRRDLGLVDGFTEPAGLAIDNARWFARLRAMGADQERTRIARDMHDRVGQSLAGVGFRLETLARRTRSEPLRNELEELRAEVRGALGEVRETLCDLRTDVSDGRGLADTLEGFLQRVRGRGEMDIRFDNDSYGRLPLAQERELWRIAHEAITNVERHAGARHLRVTWESDGRSASLVVADDGRGFTIGRDGRIDSYGILGMRERADAIGAGFQIASGPDGTTVRCELLGATTDARTMLSPT
jgi:signal transduction histidine kinase